VRYKAEPNSPTVCAKLMPRGYKAYPNYKDSGVEWLGDIPDDWGSTKLKYVGETIIGLTYSPNNIVDGNNGVLVLRSSNIQHGVIAYDDNVYVDSRIPNKLITKVDDILICTRNGSRKLIGKNALIDIQSKGLSFGAFTSVFRSDSNLFVFYILNSSLFTYQSGRFMTTTINQLTTGTLNSFEIALPPLQEQKSIANYLDKATAKIDTLIEKQTKLIALLKEKRQAVISSAVTRGLDASVPMKDSGVEWLGEIPEHWGLSKTGLLLKYLSYGFTNPMPTTSDGPIMLTANDIQYDHIEYQKARSTSRDAYETLLTSKSKPKKHDLLLTKDGTLGRVAIHEGGDVCINQSVALLRVNENKMSSLFLLKALLGSNYQNRMIYEAGGTTIKHIYISRLAKMALAVPPLIEQRVIVDYISKKQQQYNSLIKKSTQAVELLKEKRTALISAAVTGKIDVRDAA